MDIFDTQDNDQENESQQDNNNQENNANDNKDQSKEGHRFTITMTQHHNKGLRGPVCLDF